MKHFSLRPYARIILVAALFANAALAEVPQVDAVQRTGEIGTWSMEGAVSDLEGNFYFCNMAAEGLDLKQHGNVGVLRSDGAAEVFVTLPEGMRGNGLRIGPDGALYLADQLGGRLVRIDRGSREVSTVHDFGSGGSSWKQNPNDVAFPPDGRSIYVSRVEEGVWRVKLDGSGVEKVVDEYANGVEISPDGKRLIIANGIFDIGEDGKVTPTGLKPDLPEENYLYTDGLRCDAEGNIYITRAGAKFERDGVKGQYPGAVHVFSPDGEYIRNIVAPHPRVHNVGFGGVDGKTLFLICPGDDGFIAAYENDIPGANQQHLRAWGVK